MHTMQIVNLSFNHAICIWLFCNPMISHIAAAFQWWPEAMIPDYNWWEFWGQLWHMLLLQRRNGYHQTDWDADRLHVGEIPHARQCIICREWQFSTAPNMDTYTRYFMTTMPHMHGGMRQLNHALLYSIISTRVFTFIWNLYDYRWLPCRRPIAFLIARFMGPTWGPSGADRTQVGPMLAPWTLLSGISTINSTNWACI